MVDEMVSARRWITYAGIDPGATTGLVAVSMPPGGTRIHDARLVGFGTVDAVAKAADAELSKAAVRARLFHKIRDKLARWRVDVAVIEEPWDALPQFGQGKRGKSGHSRGTLFTLGAHFGLALAAASDLPWDVAIATYPVTSAREKTSMVKKRGGGMMERTKAERLGWMQRRQSTIPSHERVALECALLLRTLKERPLDGVLPTRAALATEEDDNVYMAVGVLTYHLDRERGAV